MSAIGTIRDRVFVRAVVPQIVIPVAPDAIPWLEMAQRRSRSCATLRLWLGVRGASPMAGHDRRARLTGVTDPP
jgi:hypothetical protein